MLKNNTMKKAMDYPKYIITPKAELSAVGNKKKQAGKKNVVSTREIKK
jgi:hypothetical protein